MAYTPREGRYWIISEMLPNDPSLHRLKVSICILDILYITTFGMA